MKKLPFVILMSVAGFAGSALAAAPSSRVSESTDPAKAAAVEQHAEQLAQALTPSSSTDSGAVPPKHHARHHMAKGKGAKSMTGSGSVNSDSGAMGAGSSGAMGAAGALGNRGSAGSAGPGAAGHGMIGAGNSGGSASPASGMGNHGSSSSGAAGSSMMPGGSTGGGTGSMPDSTYGSTTSTPPKPGN